MCTCRFNVPHHALLQCPLCRQCVVKQVLQASELKPIPSGTHSSEMGVITVCACRTGSSSFWQGEGRHSTAIDLQPQGCCTQWPS